jgi:N-ethylmaleimide reductase
MRAAREIYPGFASHPSLFSTVDLGPYRLTNRVVMAPMTRSRATTDHVPSALAPLYYAQRATAGLIVTEASHVDPGGVGFPNTPGIHRTDQAAAWQRVARAVHDKGGRVMLQLFHAGRISHPANLPPGSAPIAPSAVAARGEIFTPEGRLPLPAPRALTTAEIPEIVAQFADAARLALALGFDGVEIHAANGYLLDQFLRDGSNRRDDRYGGSRENRARLLLEVAATVCGIWGPGRVGVRLSPLHPGNDMHDSDPAVTFGCAAAALDRLGVGYVHVVEPGPGHPSASPEGQRLVRLLRRLYRGLLIVDGGRDLASAEAALTGASADLVAFATPFIANPDLVERLAQGWPLSSPDPESFYGGGCLGYTDYPPYKPAGNSE